MLNGAVGDYVTIVRKVRGGADGYLGAVEGDEQALSVTVKLDFLDPGKAYVAQIYRDGPDTDYRTDKRHAIVIETRKVTAADVDAGACAEGRAGDPFHRAKGEK